MSAQNKNNTVIVNMFIKITNTSSHTEPRIRTLKFNHSQIRLKFTIIVKMARLSNNSLDFT